MSVKSSVAPQNQRNDSVIQLWLTKKPLRFQGTVLVALRGCDTAPKHDNSKILTRAIRVFCLNPADPREVGIRGSFFFFDEYEFIESINEFASGMDNYPMHFTMHLIHAIEVIAFHHFDDEVQLLFQRSYGRLVKALHLKPETYEEQYHRLTEDRIKNNNVSNKAGDLQHVR